MLSRKYDNYLRDANPCISPNIIIERTERVFRKVATMVTPYSTVLLPSFFRDCSSTITAIPTGTLDHCIRHRTPWSSLEKVTRMRKEIADWSWLRKALLLPTHQLANATRR